jgi:hypothetical protein
MKMKTRRMIARLTSPLFVPLRKLLVWLDDWLGTCDHQLVLQPRPCFVEFDAQSQTKVSQPQISELMKKVSKDKANLQGLGGFGDE